MDGPKEAGIPPGVCQERLAAVAQICERFKIASLLPQVLASVEFAGSHGEVDVAVLGQFKAGKSSFLNHLIGASVLPVDVLPATAVITRLRYGATDRAQVRFLSGRCEDISLDSLAAFITEAQNPGNEKQVDTVDLELASLAPFRGVRFVDTPGLGSVFAHNTAASTEWLPKVGGALVAVSATQPLGADDLKLLQDISKHTPEVVLLLTKADLLTAEQLVSVVEFTQYHAAQHMGRALLVLPFSTRGEFDEIQRRVRDHLLQEIVGHHEELFARILEHKFRSVTGACRAYLSLADRSASSAAESRAELGRLLRQEQEGLGPLRQEVEVFVRDLQARVRTAAGERFQRFRGEITRHLRDALRKEMAGWTGNLARRRQRFEAWLEQALHEEMSRASSYGPEFLEEFQREAQTSLHRTVRAFQDRLGAAIERALGIAFEGARFHAEIPEPRRPDVRVGAIFDTHVDLLWFLIPMVLFGRLFERHFLGLLPWETEKHLSRLANQWAEAANSSIRGLVGQALSFIQQELATVENLSMCSEDARPEIQEALRALDELERLG